MARKTIRQRLVALQKKFPRRNKQGYLYRNKDDLRTTFATIFVYSLIFDPKRGHSVFIWNPHRRGRDWDWKGWLAWLEGTNKASKEKGFDILNGAVMSAINSKRGTDWSVLRMIGFHGDNTQASGHVAAEGKDAIYKRKTKRKKSRRNKADAKRQSNRLRKRGR